MKGGTRIAAILRWLRLYRRRAGILAASITATSAVTATAIKLVEWRTAAVKPQFFKAKLNYLTGTDAQGKVWKEVQRHMLPVCVRDVPPCNVRELSTQEHAADAEGQFLLVPTKDKSTGHYEYSGFGYYRESLKLKNQASVPVVWAVELRSVHQHSLGDTWHGNIEIPLAATQYGQGNTLSFIIKLRLGPHGTFEPEAPIFYGDTQIATVYNISSDPHFLSSMP